MKQLGRFVTSKALEDRFAKYGPIVSSRVVINKNHTPLGYGFVIFEDVLSAEKARKGEFASKRYAAQPDPKDPDDPSIDGDVFYDNLGHVSMRELFY